MRRTRRLVQLSFLVLTLVGVFLVQGHAERWCPFGGIEALYTYATAGNLICSLGVSNFYILGGLLLVTLLLRRAFCGYVCPLGTISEWLQAVARRLGGRALPVPYRLDRALALLKYAVLAVILYFTWRTGELVFRGFDPCYALISRHGTDIAFWAYVVAGGIVLASLVIVVPFCRWLCPLAAVFTPFSRFGLARVKRGNEACSACGACRRACPMAIRVDTAKHVTAARCTSCLECVAACPNAARGAIGWGLPEWRGVPAVAQPPSAARAAWLPSTVIVALLLACIGGAVAATYAFPLPSFVQSFGDVPARTAAVSLRVRGVNCRHSSELFVEYLRRDDEYRVPGHLRVEAWPDPKSAAVRITYDPARTTAAAIKRAITEPQFDLTAGAWKFSAYRIEGYDPLEAPE